MEIVFATHNPDKFREVQALVPSGYRLLDLGAIGFRQSIPETGTTLTENATLKAKAVHEFCGLPCFADDSGLEVDALGGAPGVYSAHYAGEAGSAAHNMAKLLHELRDQDQRSARFRTVISYVRSGRYQHFEAAVGGVILRAEQGIGGFGYDPIFMPSGYTCSFAQMTLEQKNRISHRALAFQKLIDFLRAAQKN